MLTIELSNIFAFAGTNGAFTHDASNYANGFDETSGPIGIGFESGNLTLAIVGEILPVGSGEQARSWMGIGASLGSQPIDLA